MGLKCIRNFGVLFFVADDDSVYVELQSLLNEQFGTIVGCQKLDFEQIPVLSDYVQCLSADRTCRSQYGYMPLEYIIRTYAKIGERPELAYGEKP